MRSQQFGGARAHRPLGVAERRAQRRSSDVAAVLARAPRARPGAPSAAASLVAARVGRHQPARAAVGLRLRRSAWPRSARTAKSGAVERRRRAASSESGAPIVARAPRAPGRARARPRRPPDPRSRCARDRPAASRSIVGKRRAHRPVLVGRQLESHEQEAVGIDPAPPPPAPPRAPSATGRSSRSSSASNALPAWSRRAR